MNQNKVIFLLMSASAPLLLEAKRSDHRAIESNIDAKSKYPYVVALLVQELFRGGTGSLITSEWVLTAAHCFDEDVSHIQYGNMSLSSTSLIIEKRRHPSYKPAKMSNDIGLCRVKPVELRTFGILSAIDYTSLLGKPVEYAGYSLKQYPLLQIGKGIMIPWKAMLGGSHGPMIGVASKCSDKDSDTATGHSGGPMFYDGKLAGIISFGVDSPGPIGPYTAVSSYTTWIQDVVISQNNKKKLRVRRRKFVIKLPT